MIELDHRADCLLSIEDLEMATGCLTDSFCIDAPTWLT